MVEAKRTVTATLAKSLVKKSNHHAYVDPLVLNTIEDGNIILPAGANVHIVVDEDDANLLGFWGDTAIWLDVADVDKGGPYAPVKTARSLCVGRQNLPECSGEAEWWIKIQAGKLNGWIRGRRGEIDPPDACSSAE